MRLIDADKLIDYTDDRYSLHEIGRRERDDIVWALESAPTVDAVPVRHGHYVGEGDGYANGELVYDVWKCSECGCVFEDDYEKPTYNYCPNCGARMDADD